LKNIFYLTEDGNGRQSFVGDGCGGRPGVEGGRDFDMAYIGPRVLRTLIKPCMSLGNAHLFVKYHGRWIYEPYLIFVNFWYTTALF